MILKYPKLKLKGHKKCTIHTLLFLINNLETFLKFTNCLHLLLLDHFHGKQKSNNLKTLIIIERLLKRDIQIQGLNPKFEIDPNITIEELQ